MTDIEHAIEAMRTRTTDDGHIATIERLVQAATMTLDSLANSRGYIAESLVPLREALHSTYTDDDA